MKNLQFWSNLAQTLSNWLPHFWEHLIKFHQNWTKIVDFSLLATFEASLIFYESVFSLVFWLFSSLFMAIILNVQKRPQEDDTKHPIHQRFGFSILWLTFSLQEEFGHGQEVRGFPRKIVVPGTKLVIDPKAKIFLHESVGMFPTLKIL